MLDIRINGQSLDLFPDTALTFEQYNPLFQQEVGAEGYSYPIDIPASDTNRIAFSFIENIQSTTPFKDYPCELIANNAPKKGIFSILKASESRYSCSMYLGLFDKNILDKTLNTLDLGGIRTVTDIIAHANSLTTKTVDDADYVFFPIWNNAFYGEGNGGQPDFLGIINNYQSNSFIPFSVSIDSFGDNYILQPNTLVPFPYLIFILKSIAKELGKTLRGSFVTHPEIKKLTIYNTRSLDEIRTDTARSLDGNIFSETINMQNHVPNYTVREFLNALIAKFNVAINVTDTELQIVFKTDILNALNDDDYTDIVEQDMPIEPFRKKDTEGYTFTETTDTNDAALTEFSKITLIDGKIRNDIAEFSGLHLPATLDDVQFVVATNQFYKAFKAGNLGTPSYHYQLYEGAFNAATFKVGRGDEKRELKISTLLMGKHIPTTQEIPEISDFILLPIAHQKGNSPVVDYNTGTDNDYSLRLMFYRGLQPKNTTTFETYPLGTNDIYNAVNAAIGYLSLQQSDIYESFHKKWLALIDKSKALNINIGITPEQWARFDFYKPKNLINQSIIFEKITFTIAANGMRKATARVLKR